MQAEKGKRQPPTAEQIRKQQNADAERGRAAIKARLPAVSEQQLTLPAIPAIQGTDAFIDRNPSMLVGRIIRPNGKDGTVIFTDDGTVVPNSQPFTVIVDSIWAGLVRLVEGEPSQYAGGLLFDKDFRRPGRDEVGDTSVKDWPISKFDNLPTDPWKECVLVPLEGETGEMFTLQIQSKPRSAAIYAIDGLLRHCRQLRRRHPDFYPVIKIGMVQYESKKFGMQWKPNFQIIGKTEKASVSAPDTSIAADMNDEIGF
jgi:hypothetical protein